MKYSSKSIGAVIFTALVSCSGPGVKILEEPIAHTPLLKTLVNSNKLTDEAKAYLAEHGLKSSYRINPSATILMLHDKVSQSPSMEGRSVVAELCYNMAEDSTAKLAGKSLGYYMASAEMAYPGLNSGGASHDHTRLVAIYNLSTGAAVKQMADRYRDEKQKANKQTVIGPWRGYTCRWNSSGKLRFAPDYFDQLNRASYVKIKGMDDQHRHIVAGVGSAMVGHRSGMKTRRAEDPFLNPSGMSLPVTAFMRFDNKGQGVELSLLDALKTQTVPYQGRSLKLAADYTASLVAIFNYQTIKMQGFKRLLHPEEYMNTCQLDEVSPFDPDKIPLIFVHGLASEPATWTAAINKVWGDPVLRERYQVLVYSYPTGFPISYNSSLFRDWLKKYDAKYNTASYRPKLRQMVLVGHSMGCLLSNAQIRTSGDGMLDLYITKPMDEIHGLSAKEKETLLHINVYEANTNVRRAIFFAGPHRGSDIASNLIGKLGVALIHLPKNVWQNGTMGKVDGLTPLGKERMHHVPDSIVELRPHAPYLMTVLKEPISPRVTYHTIVGRSNPSDEVADSSDKVVPYWSSQLKDAESEKVVHAIHTTITSNDEALTEMRRILYLHLGLNAQN